jgi:hypothetical protein
MSTLFLPSERPAPVYGRSRCPVERLNFKVLLRASFANSAGKDGFVEVFLPASDPGVYILGLRRTKPCRASDSYDASIRPCYSITRAKFIFRRHCRDHGRNCGHRTQLAGTVAIGISRS